MKKYLAFIQEHWVIIGTALTAFWAFLTALFNVFVLPIVDSHIDERVMILAEDSLGKMVDTHMINKGGGFRGGFSDLTDVPKDSVIIALASIYNKEQNRKEALDTLLFASNYQHAFDEEIMKMICTRQEYNHVLYFVAPTGDYYYKDDKGYIWSANYSMADDCFYYYPPYNGNKRTKCE